MEARDALFKRYPRDEDNRKRFIADCIRYGAAEPRAKQSQGVVREGGGRAGTRRAKGRRNDVRARRQKRGADPKDVSQPSVRPVVSVCATAMPESLIVRSCVSVTPKGQARHTVNRTSSRRYDFILYPYLYTLLLNSPSGMEV